MKKLHSFQTRQFFLEVSETSRLFTQEMEKSKVVNTKDAEEQEKLRLEILEKERMLMELIEKEKKEKLAKEKAKEEALTLRRLSEEKVLKEKEEAVKQAELQKQEIEKEEIKSKIVQNVTEIITQKIEKLKEELIKKTVEETTKAIDQSFYYSNSNKKPNNSVHERYTCDGCGVFPIVGARFKCNECHDFDFCEKCEEKLGDEHGHEMTKHRTAVQRIGGCPWKRERGFGKNMEEKKEGYRFRQFPRCRNQFMKFFTEQFHNVKDFFCSKVNPNDINLEMLMNMEKCNEKQTETTTDGEKKEDIVVENEQKEEKKVSYQNELFALRSTFDLGSKTDEEIMNALVKANGNMDDAVILLFQ